MKILITLILTLSLLTILGVNRRSDLQNEGLAGQVRIILEYRLHETQEVPNFKAGDFKKGSPYQTISYNQKGDRTEQTYLYGPPKIVYSYADDGSRTVNEWYDGRNTGSGLPGYPVPGEPYQEKYKYDARGRKIEKSTGKAPHQLRNVYSYDEDRLKEEQFYTLKDSSLFRRILYTYNEKGMVNRELWYGKNDLLEDEITYSDYKYDSRVNWIMRKAIRHQRYDKDMPAHQMWWEFREISYY